MGVPTHDNATPAPLLPGTTQVDIISSNLDGDGDDDALISANPILSLEEYHHQSAQNQLDRAAAHSPNADEPAPPAWCGDPTDANGEELSVAIRISSQHGHDDDTTDVNDVMSKREASAHCDDDAVFGRVEAERRAINIAAAGQERLFVSHCWRNAATQYRKRRILAHLSTPVKAGGPGLVYWGDFLDLQAEGPIPWRKEIEEGIAACSKFVALVDKAWLTSYNCLQELVMAIEHSKPIVVLILDGGGWELLTVPGGATKAAEEADFEADDQDSAWTDSSYAAPLCSYDGEEIVPGKKMSSAVMKSLFSRLASINMCPCRELEETTRGWDGLLTMAAEYVKKDLVYYKEHAQLKGKATAWEKAVQDGGPKPLLQTDESVYWQGWISRSHEYDMNPAPTELMEKFVKASLNQAARRVLLIRLMALLLALVLAAGAAASTVLAIRATTAEKDAVLKAEEAINASNWASAAQLEAELQAGLATAAQGLAQEEAIKAQIGSRLSTSLAVTTILDQDPHVSTWRLKLLNEAIDRLPTSLTTATNGTLLNAGRELLRRPTVNLVAPRQDLLANHDEGSCPYQNCQPNMFWSPDGRTLASHSYPRVEIISIWVWLENGTMNTTATQELHASQPTNPRNRLRAVVWAPDSSRLATVTNDLTIHIWARLDDGTVNTAATQVLHHNRPTEWGTSDNIFPKSAAWSPDGTMLAVASYINKEIHIWARLEDGSMNTTVSQVLYGNSREIVWSPGLVHSSVLVAESDDNTILIWQPATNGGMNATVSQVISGYADRVTQFSYAPDGLLLATYAIDQRGVRILERLEDGSMNTTAIQLLLRASGRYRQANHIEWAPDGSAIAVTYSDSSVWVWQKQLGRNMLDESSLKILQGGWRASWSPDGSTLAAGATGGGDANHVAVWFQDMISTEAPPQLLEYSQAMLRTEAVAWVPGSNDKLTTGTGDGAIHLWKIYPDGLPGAAPQVLELPKSMKSSVKSISWASNGLALTSVSADGDMISFWRSHTNRSFESPQHIPAAMPDGGQTGVIPEVDESYHFDYYGNYFYNYGYYYGYYGDYMDDSPTSYALTAAEWSPSGATLAAAEGNDVLLWHAGESLDADSLTTPPQLLSSHSSPVRTLAWAPDAELLVSGALDGTIHLWHAGQANSNFSLFAAIEGHTGWVLDLDFSPDGSMLASCSSDGNVRIWSSTQTWAGAPQVLPGHSDWVWSVAWSPDGGALASSSADSLVLIWAVLPNGTIDTTAAPQTLQGHKGYVYALAWAPHGSWLASGSADSSIKIWARNQNGVFDTSSPQLLDGQGGSVRALAWSVDGSLLASGSADGDISLWGLLSVSSMKTAMMEDATAATAVSLRLTDAEILEYGLPFTLFDFNSSDSQLIPADDDSEGPAAPEAAGGMEQLTDDMARPSGSRVKDALLDFMRHQLSEHLTWTWTEDADVCDWSGSYFAWLECEEGTLTVLRVSSEHLKGPLPDSWSAMSDLKDLSFSYSRLTGPLPKSWSAMTALKKMELGNNELITGSLPESWSQMSALESLKIHNMPRVSGPLPQAWSTMASLSELKIHNMPRVSGPLPPAWSAMASLSDLLIQNIPKVSGPLPPAWSAMSALVDLNVHVTNQTGSLPKEWSAFSAMHSLALSDTLLTGSLPEEWSNMAGLEDLNLAGNSLTGTLPESWSEMGANIGNLRLPDNSLRGKLPESWSTLSIVSTLDLGDNQLSGPLPESWSSIANSAPWRPQMSLRNNQLTGTVPEAWGNITVLETLDMSGNSLTGSLPEPLKSCMIMRDEEGDDNSEFAFDFDYDNEDCQYNDSGSDDGSFGSWY